jgi:hypothetical protein
MNKNVVNVAQIRLKNMEKQKPVNNDTNVSPVVKPSR